MTETSRLGTRWGRPMGEQDAARKLLRELNDTMKSPRGDYYQGDIADPHRTLHIIERHLDTAIAHAREEENEACAKEAEHEFPGNGTHRTWREIAAAIRARIAPTGGRDEQ